MLEMQGRPSGESTGLPLMCPGSILGWCHIWVEFVVCSYFALRGFV